MSARRLLLIAALVAACSNAGSTGATNAPIAGASSSAGSSGGVGSSAGAQPSLRALPTAATGTAATSVATDAATPAATDAPGANASFRPSGALIRVVNLYNDGTGAPAPIDVYGDYSALGAALRSVPYGTASDWFDPGVLDDQGNAHVSFFPSGKRASDDALIDQSETLKGTERITMIVGTGENKKSDGTYFGQIEILFENSTLNPLPTAPASKALVVVDLLALYRWPGPGPGLGTDYMYLSVGKDCLKTLEGEGDQYTGVQPLSPHRGVSRFSIPSGPQKLSLHSTDTCTDASPYPDIPINLAPGARSQLVFYSSDYVKLETLLLPLNG
jgi:hypothetical protein